MNKLFRKTSYNRDVSHIPFPKISRDVRGKLSYTISNVLPTSYNKLIIRDLQEVGSNFLNGLDFRVTATNPCPSLHFARYTGDSEGKYNSLDWECVPFTTCDYETEWQSFDGSPSEDVECTPLTDCTGGKYFIREKTRTSDRVCVDLETYLKAVYNATELQKKIDEKLDSEFIESMYEKKISTFPCKHKLGMIPTQKECRCDDLTCHPGEYCYVAPLESLCLTSARDSFTTKQCGLETCYGDQRCFGTLETQMACLNYDGVSVEEGESLYLPFDHAGHMSTNKYIKFKDGDCTSMTEDDCRSASKSGQHYRKILIREYQLDFYHRIKG